ncbi:MAG: hypothetical protein U0401_06285 [Anaerolineae bacterium]
MNRQTMFLMVCLLSPALILPACASSIVQLPTPTPTASSTATPSPTLAPPTPIVTPTPTPQPSQTPTATTLPPADTWSSPSPNGQWTAQGMLTAPFPATDGSEQYQTRLEVVNTTGTVKWTLADQTLNYGLGYTTPRPFHWSADGRYLYFTNLAVSDGCSLFHNGSDLYRADLSTGQVTEIVPPGVWWVSLSPDEQTAAYIPWNGEALLLTILNLATGNYREMTFEGKYTQAGNIIWSPEGQALMLTLATNPCDSANWTQSIARVDVATLSSTILIRDDKRLFVTTEWPEAGTVELTDKDGDTWTLEVTSGELEKKEK